MSSPIAAIGAISQFTAAAPAAPVNQLRAAAGTTIATGDTSSGLNFSQALANGIDAVQASQAEADSLAVQAATGELVDPAQLTIATTKAALMTQLATTVQSKAVQAFNTIMSMQA